MANTWWMAEPDCPNCDGVGRVVKEKNNGTFVWFLCLYCEMEFAVDRGEEQPDY